MASKLNMDIDNTNVYAKVCQKLLIRQYTLYISMDMTLNSKIYGAVVLWDDHIYE